MCEEEQEVSMAKDWSSKTRYANSINNSFNNSITDSYADTGCDTFANTDSHPNTFPDSHHCTSASELCGIL
jgi:hypothetical protein